MTPRTTETRHESRAGSTVWIAAGLGAAAGIAALAYNRRRRSRWDQAKDRASDFIDTAREEFEPWMGIAAGAAALGAYLRSRKESGWERAAKRAGEIASRARTQATTPWANLAATAAIGLVSVTYATRARRRTIRGMDANTADKINAVTERAVQVVRRVRDISEETGKRVRQAIV